VNLLPAFSLLSFKRQKCSKSSKFLEEKRLNPKEGFLHLGGSQHSEYDESCSIDRLDTDGQSALRAFMGGRDVRRAPCLAAIARCARLWADGTSALHA
jgi:hypothetical protein